MKLVEKLALTSWIILIFYFILNALFWVSKFVIFGGLALAIALLVINIIYLRTIIKNSKSNNRNNIFYATGIVNIVDCVLFFLMFLYFFGSDNSLFAEPNSEITAEQILASWMVIILYLIMESLTIASFVMAIISWKKSKYPKISSDNNKKLENLNYNKQSNQNMSPQTKK